MIRHLIISRRSRSGLRNLDTSAFKFQHGMRVVSIWKKLPTAKTTATNGKEQLNPQDYKFQNYQHTFRDNSSPFTRLIMKCSMASLRKNFAAIRKKELHGQLSN